MNSLMWLSICNFGPILHRFWDTATFFVENFQFFNPSHLTPLIDHFGISGKALRILKLDIESLTELTVKMSWSELASFTRLDRVVEGDRHTDGRTSLLSRGRLHSKLCGRPVRNQQPGCFFFLTATHTVDMSPASTATNISDLQIVVNCRFRGSGCQPTEAVLLDMPVHLLGTLFRTFLNAAHTLYQLLDAIWNIFTSRSTSTQSAFDVITVNALYKLLTYLLTYTDRYSKSAHERKCYNSPYPRNDSAKVAIPYAFSIGMRVMLILIGSGHSGGGSVGTETYHVSVGWFHHRLWLLRRSLYWEIGDAMEQATNTGSSKKS